MTTQSSKKAIRVMQCLSTLADEYCRKGDKETSNKILAARDDLPAESLARLYDILEAAE